MHHAGFIPAAVRQYYNCAPLNVSFLAGSKASINEGSVAAEIAAGLEGKQGFESHLAALTRKKEDLQKRIDSNKQWTVRGHYDLIA